MIITEYNWSSHVDQFNNPMPYNPYPYHPAFSHQATYNINGCYNPNWITPQIGQGYYTGIPQQDHQHQQQQQAQQPYAQSYNMEYTTNAYNNSYCRQPAVVCPEGWLL